MNELREERLSGRARHFRDSVEVAVIKHNNCCLTFPLPRATAGISVERIIQHVLDIFPRFGARYKCLAESQKMQALFLRMDGEEQQLERDEAVFAGSRVLVFLQIDQGREPQPRSTTTRLEDEDATCSICLQEITDDAVRRELTCGHLFHLECIESWFVEKASCPLCRRVVRG